MLHTTHLRSVALGLAVAAVAVASGIWPQWRGPERDGRIYGSDWPDSLRGLAQQWRIPLGKSYSGPIVSDELVFVTEAVDEANEGVRALSRADGREVWRFSWAGQGDVPFFAERNGEWIRSTPAYDGETLYLGGMEEKFFALDARTGRERWSVNLPERFDVAPPDFGFASSPLVDGDDLYLQAANSVVKLDKRTGKTLWRVLESGGSMMSSGAFSSPVLATLAGRRQLVVQGRYTLQGLDPADGETLWTVEVPNFRGMNILTPTIWGDGIFTSSYKNQTYFYKVEAADGGMTVREAWRNKVNGYMSSPVVWAGAAFLHLGNRRLTAIDLTTGASLWTSLPLGEYWSMVSQGEKILALDSEGTLRLIRADRSQLGILDARQVADAETWAHLAVAGNDVYVRELEAITAFRWESGEPARSE